MKEFKSIPKDKNRWYIVDQSDKPVLLYQKNTIGRWAGLNEYCLYTTREDEVYGKELIVQHGGFLRAVMRCLNGDKLTARQMNDIRHILPELEKLRK
jgi:hypothetical protein